MAMKGIGQHLSRMTKDAGNWLAQLHGRQLLMLLVAAAVYVFVLVVVGFTYIPNVERASHSLARGTDYSSYRAAREDTLRDRDLWQTKMVSGFSASEALVYTALRPGGSSKPALVDSARRVLEDWHRDLERARAVVYAAWISGAAMLLGMAFSLWLWLGARKHTPSET